MWILFMNCVQCDAPDDSGDSGLPFDSSVAPWVDDCGFFWPHDDVGMVFEYDYTSTDGWTTGRKEIEVLREDTWEGRRAWVHWETGRKNTGSARHRWETERWYVCDIEGVWYVGGHTKYTTVRDLEKDQYEYADVVEEPAFVAPRQVAADSYWYSTGVVIHIDDEDGSEISRTVLEAEHVGVGRSNHRVRAGTFDAVQVHSGVPGTTDPDQRWLSPGLGEIENENWELSWYR